MQGERNGAVPMPVNGAPRPFGGMPGELRGYGPMEMPRSPPKNKSEYTGLLEEDVKRLTV